MTIVTYTVNNYILGNKIPRIGGKIVAQKRIDKTHTEVTVEFETKTDESMADTILMVVIPTGNGVAIWRKAKQNMAGGKRKQPALLFAPI